MFNIGNIVGLAAGALIMLGLAAAYDAIWDDPRVRADATAIAEAEARKRTETAINEVQDDAEKARAMRRYCRDSGSLYDFSTGRCRED